MLIPPPPLEAFTPVPGTNTVCTSNGTLVLRRGSTGPGATVRFGINHEDDPMHVGVAVEMTEVARVVYTSFSASGPSHGLPFVPARMALDVIDRSPFIDQAVAEGGPGGKRRYRHFSIVYDEYGDYDIVAPDAVLGRFDLSPAADVEIVPPGCDRSHTWFFVDEAAFIADLLSWTPDGRTESHRVEVELTPWPSADDVPSHRDDYFAALAKRSPLDQWELVEGTEGLRGPVAPVLFNAGIFEAPSADVVAAAAIGSEFGGGSVRLDLCTAIHGSFTPMTHTDRDLEDPPRSPGVWTRSHTPLARAVTATYSDGEFWDAVFPGIDAVDVLRHYSWTIDGFGTFDFIALNAEARPLPLAIPHDLAPDSWYDVETDLLLAALKLPDHRIGWFLPDP